MPGTVFAKEKKKIFYYFFCVCKIKNHSIKASALQSYKPTWYEHAHPFHSTLNMQLTCSYHQNDVKKCFGTKPIFHVHCGKFGKACIWKGISCINVHMHIRTTFIALIKFLVDFKAGLLYWQLRWVCKIFVGVSLANFIT